MSPVSEPTYSEFKEAWLLFLLYQQLSGNLGKRGIRVYTGLCKRTYSFSYKNTEDAKLIGRVSTINPLAITPPKSEISRRAVQITVIDGVKRGATIELSCSLATLLIHYPDLNSTREFCLSKEMRGVFGQDE